MRKIRIWITMLIALALVAAACGGDADEPAEPDAPATTAAPAPATDDDDMDDDAMDDDEEAMDDDAMDDDEEAMDDDAMDDDEEAMDDDAMDDDEEVTTTTAVTGEGLMAGSCAPPSEAAPPRGVAPVDGLTIIKAYSGDVPNIDPRLNFEARGSELAANMYDQLITFHLEENEDGVLVADSTRPQGLLAESWEFNEDCTSVTFTLRQGVLFNHTKNEMTARDVKWSFRRAALHQDRVGGWFDHAVIGLYDYGDEETIDDVITVIDDYTIRFDFLYPTPFPLHVLSNAGVTVYDSAVLSTKGTTDDPWARGFLQTTDTGTGPFYLESIEPGVQVTLRRNDDYFLGPAQAEQIILRVIPDTAQQAALLSAGEIDFAEAVPVTAIPELREQGVKVTTVGGNNQAVMYMNPTRPPFDDVNLRKAIAYAYPYDEVLEGVYFGAADRGGGPIPRSTPTFDPDAPFYTYDLDQAREHLAASSYAGETLQLYIDGTLAFAPELAIVVQASLGQIGIDVEIVRLSAGDFQENAFAEDSTKTDPLEARINPMDFFLFYFGSGSWVNEPQYHMELFWEVDAYAMRSNYSNELVTEKLEAAKLLSPAEPERTQLYQEVQTIMLEDAPAVWLAEPHLIVASSQAIEGFIWRPDQINRYYYVTKSS